MKKAEKQGKKIGVLDICFNSNLINCRFMTTDFILCKIIKLCVVLATESGLGQDWGLLVVRASDL